MNSIEDFDSKRSPEENSVSESASVYHDSLVQKLESSTGHSVLLGLSDNQLASLDLGDARTRELIRKAFDRIQNLLLVQPEEDDISEILTTQFSLIAADFSDRNREVSDQTILRMKILVLSFQEFANKQQFWSYLKEKYGVKDEINDMKKIVLLIFYQWIKFFWERDFHASNTLMKRLKTFLEEQKESKIDAKTNYLDQVQEMVQMQEKRISFLNRERNAFRETRYFQSHEILQRKSELLARLLTSCTGDRFSKIHSGELMKASWKKKKKASLAPNVIGLLNLVNAIAFWTQGVVLKAKDLARRGETIAKLIKIADICYREYRDICTTGAIIMALNTHNVWSLKHAWKSLDQSRWRAFCSYKALLVGTSTKQSDDCKLIHQDWAKDCENEINVGIPYFTWVTSELYKTSLDKSEKSSGALNQTKFANVTEVVEIVLKFQSSWEELSTRLKSKNNLQSMETQRALMENTLGRFWVEDINHEQELANELDSLADKAKASDSKEASTRRGCCKYSIPQRAVLISYACFVIADVLTNYALFAFFGMNFAKAGFWFFISVLSVTTSRIVQVGIIYVTKYNEHITKYSVSGKFWSMFITFFGFGIPLSLYRFLYTAKETKGIRDPFAGSRDIPQDLSIRSTAADLEFSRLRGVYIVESMFSLFLKLYIILGDDKVKEELTWFFMDSFFYSIFWIVPSLFCGWTWRV